MAVSKSILSAGEIINAVLRADSEVTTRSNKIFPVIVDSAELPYIIYRRTQLEQTPVKTGRGANSASIEVLCCTKDYLPGVELAEAVREALDGKTAEVDGLTMRGCYLADSEEAWQDGAFVQQLVFNVKI